MGRKKRCFELPETSAQFLRVNRWLTKVFEKALADIANGADVADTLDAAVDEIDIDIENNKGYGH